MARKMTIMDTVRLLRATKRLTEIAETIERDVNGQEPRRRRRRATKRAVKSKQAPSTPTPKRAKQSTKVARGERGKALAGAPAE